MGNHRQALQLIVTQLQDVEYAIDFCKEHNYESLWNELIDYSLSKPSKQPTGFLLINFRVLFRLQLNYECYSFEHIAYNRCLELLTYYISNNTSIVYVNTIC